jgi:hypothetical protein
MKDTEFIIFCVDDQPAVIEPFMHYLKELRHATHG